MPRLLCFLLISIGSLTGLSAQQYGHLNFANLLSQMPGTEAAEAELAAYNQQLVERGEQMVEDLRARVREVESQIEDLPPVRVEELRVELNGEREKIGQYEQQMAVDLETKRRELLGPLIQQARDAIDAVARENGYLLVFDTSQFNTVLFAQDSDDLMALVKAKLGM
ncbi:OmpH family outer membrane protein [Lewinella sp. JB7]|uniref:OmpH family outer membrane protein n=1 Tax=Lewinella sp. JB7 TaxID=2962887 RepID=UPI0020CA1A16|nr:OmpH family outer membrane protein [Lewinella sp. JB7]MCP9236438.1 OmpH family outer membrane protein [Lewinella sp. JB7]